LERCLESGIELLDCVTGIRPACRECDFFAVAHPQRHDRSDAARVGRFAVSENRYLGSERLRRLREQCRRARMQAVT
jgi:hypothetical protein